MERWWYRVVLSAAFGLLGGGGGTAEPLAYPEPYAADSFQALMAPYSNQKPTPEALEKADSIVDSKADTVAGADAVAYVAENMADAERALVWLAGVVEDHPDTAAGARALDLLLTRYPETKAREEAYVLSNKHLGKKAGLVALRFIVQAYLDGRSPEGLRKAIVAALGEYRTEALQESFSVGQLVMALDAAGAPLWAKRASEAWAGNPDQQSEFAKACREALKRYDLEAAGQEVSGRLTTGFSGIFAADFVHDRAAFTAGYEGVRSLSEALAEGKVAMPDTPESILLAIDEIVEGLCWRARSPRSFFGSENALVEETSVVGPLDGPLVAALQKWPEQNDAICRRALQWGDTVGKAGLPFEAHGFYSFVVERAIAPEVAHPAQFALARIFADSWQAYDVAEGLLRDAIDTGASPQAHALLGSILYRAGDYDGTLDALSQYAQLEKDPARVDKAFLIMGGALGKLGRNEEKQALFRDLRARTQDSELRSLLDRELAAAQHTGGSAQ